ncbi:MAG TPA: hypothetical protein VE075_02630, partial [Thermoanaerobaculia bacterium]|nr:hypothetical protein [Thermoanaerobaculia bacterium]
MKPTHRKCQRPATAPPQPSFAGRGPGPVNPRLPAGPAAATATAPARGHAARRLLLAAALAGAALGAPSLVHSGQSGQASPRGQVPAGQAPAAPGAAAQQAPAAPSPAAEPQPPPQSVTIESHRGQRPKIKLAFPAFRPANLAGDMTAASGELEATVRADLDFSGYFEIRGAEAFVQAKLSGDVEHDLPAYRGSGAEVVLLGDTHSEEDKLVFEGRLFDVGSGKAILAKRYRGKTTVTRRMAHTFADEVVRYLTGSPGIAMSAIAFTSDRTGEGRKEIFIMDYDGKNQ